MKRKNEKNQLEQNLNITLTRLTQNLLWKKVQVEKGNKRGEKSK